MITDLEHQTTLIFSITQDDKNTNDKTYANIRLGHFA